MTIIEEKENNLLTHVFWTRGRFSSNFYNLYDLQYMAVISPKFLQYVSLMLG